MTAAALVCFIASAIGLGVPAVDKLRRWWRAEERALNGFISSALDPDRSTR